MQLKSLLFLALAGSLTLGITATPSKKNKKKVQPAPAAAVQQGVGGAEFSYAVGVAQADGLRRFIEQRFSLDSTQFATFGDALLGKYSAEEVRRARAIAAGADIADENERRLRPTFNKQATGKEDTTYFDTQIFARALVEALAGKASLSADSAAALVRRQGEFALERAKSANLAYLETYKAEKGVKSTPSGLLYKEIKKGTGALPADTSQVEVHYEGRLIDGTIFDSSYQRGQTATFGVTQVIKGWTEALRMMPVGSTYELCIPYDLAYGEQGNRSIPPYATLIFKVELIGIK